MAFSVTKVRKMILKELENTNHLLHYCINHSTPLPPPVGKA